VFSQCSQNHICVFLNKSAWFFLFEVVNRESRMFTYSNYTFDAQTSERSEDRKLEL
jgi:hypothetical protein